MIHVYFTNEFIMFCVHVDDMYIISSTNSEIDKLYQILSESIGEITRKDGNTLSYLGMHIERKNDYITITQPGYVKKILNRAGIQDHELSDTPMSVSKVVTDDNEDMNEAVDKHQYLELIGMLNYLAVLTRPDILYPVSRAAQRCSNPTKSDLLQVKKIFKYINNTQDIGLKFTKDNNFQLRAWVDASHVQYREDSKGHYGYCFSLGDNDSVFYAKSSKMKIVTPAGSAETEYVAMYEAATEIVFLRGLLEELGFEQNDPTILYEDNKSAIAQVLGKGNFHKQKHIMVKYHYTRELIENKVLTPVYCPSEDNVADILTKPTSKGVLEHLRNLMFNPITD